MIARLIVWLGAWILEALEAGGARARAGSDRLLIPEPWARQLAGLASRIARGAWLIAAWPWRRLWAILRGIGAAARSVAQYASEATSERTVIGLGGLVALWAGLSLISLAAALVLSGAVVVVIAALPELVSQMRRQRRD